MAHLCKILTLVSAIWLGSVWMTTVHAQPSGVPDMLAEQSEHLPIDQVEQYWQELIQEYGGYFPGNRAPTFMELMLPGGEGFDYKQLFKGFLTFFLHEILYNGKLLVTIIILTIFSMILETLQSAFEHRSVSKVAYAISYMVLIVIAINSFSVSISFARSAIEAMIHFMVAMIPLLLALLSALGGLISVTVLHPLIIFMIHTIGTLVYMFVFPLLFFSAVLHIVSSLSDQFKLTQLADLMRKISVGVLGFSLTVFLGVISVQGAASAASDGVTLRTAKYVTGNFVPVVGGLFADATDTVLGASLLVKNAIGLAGVIIIVLLCVFPALKILALAAIYQVTAAVMQPLGNSPIVICLRTIGKSMIYIFAALASVGLMFFLAITIIITAGNVAIMMR